MEAQKWYAISWSWRVINEDIKKDVERTVKNILNNWHGIVTWWALGVDYIATKTVLRRWDPKTQLKIYLPIPLESFMEHYWKRALEWIITPWQADIIITQLKKVHELSPESIKDTTPYTEATVESYYARNNQIIENAYQVHAFQVNDSQWTQDTIDKAMKMGKNVSVKKYSI